MEEVIAIVTAYNAVANSNPLRVSRTDVDGSNTVTIGTKAVYGSGTSVVFTGPPPCVPPSILWNNSIGNIQKTTNPNLSKVNELNARIVRSSTNDPIAPYISSQIFGDKFSNSSSRDIYSRCCMYFAADSIQTVAPQFVTRGLPTIDTLDENCVIRSPTTIIIKKVKYHPSERVRACCST